MYLVHVPTGGSSCRRRPAGGLVAQGLRSGCSSPRHRCGPSPLSRRVSAVWQNGSGHRGTQAFSRCSRKESRCSVPISEIRLVHLQKPQYRTTRHDLSAPDRQVAIYDKAMQHKHPLISPFAERTMVTRWSLLNCLFRLGRLTLLVRGPTLEPPHGKALRAHIMLCRHA
jgi:hypothetical protein